MKRKLTNQWYKLIPRLLQNSDYAGRFHFLCDKIEKEEQEKAKQQYGVLQKQITENNLLPSNISL